MAIRRRSSLRLRERSWEGGVGMRIVHSLDELAEALAEGGDEADLVRDDGVWRSNPDADRAADLTTFCDHVRLLVTGGEFDRLT